MSNYPVLEFESFLNEKEKKIRTIKTTKPRSIKLLPDEKPYGINSLLGAMSENIYLACDWHIGDPISNCEDRRDRLIEVVNQIVKPDDHLLILGDLSAHTITANINDVKNTIRMINCKNLYLILGNNDQESIETYVDMGFKTVTDKFIWKNLVFTHMPAKIDFNQINIHGHIHEELIYINVDWHNHANVWDKEMTPIRLKDVLERYKSGYYKGTTINDEEDLDNHNKEKYFNEGTLESTITDNDLTKFSWYHIELERDGFDSDTCSKGWDEELYCKSIDDAIKSLTYTIKNMEHRKTAAYLWTADLTDGIEPIYLGKIAIYRTNLEEWFNWEWEEQEDLSNDIINKIIKSQNVYYISESTKRSELPDEVFGVPEERKYPLETREHVYSAVKLFNHVNPKYEEELAKNIIKKMDEYGIDDITPGENNRFGKYYKK